MNFLKKISSYFHPFVYSVVVFDKKDGKILFKKKGSANEWFADPFLLNFQGQEYLFVEDMLTKNEKAGISVFNIKNSSRKNLLDNRTHFSFPNVFVDGSGQIVMIPESVEQRRLLLFGLVNDKFVLKKVISENVMFADNVVYAENSSHFLFCYDVSKNGSYFLRAFTFDPATFVLGKEVFAIADLHQQFRPAGNIVSRNGKKYLPTQKCDLLYGEKILFREISICGDLIQLSDPVDASIVLPEIIHNYARYHTYNEDENYATIDVSKRCFSLFAGLRTITKLFLKKTKSKS